MMGKYDVAVDKVNAMLESEATPITDLVKALATIQLRVDTVDASVDPLRKAATLLRNRIVVELAKTGEKTRSFPGSGKVTIIQRDGYSMEDPMMFYSMLADMLHKGAAPVDVFAWLGKSVSGDMAKMYLSDNGELPPGLTKSSTNSLRFTPN
jgi:hypothetical protein